MTDPNSTAPDDALRALIRRRWRVALAIATLMVAVYFGFVLLIAFDKPLMGRQFTPGVSIGIALGVVVIGMCWVATWLYVRWANRHFDGAVERLRGGRP